MSNIQEQNVNQVVLASEFDHVVVTAELIKSEDFSKKYQSLDNLIDYLTTIKKAVNAGIQKIIEADYEEKGESSIRSEDYTFTYVAPSTKTSFDSKKLKEDNPELYAKYVKTSNVSGSLRVTPRKKKEAEDKTVAADYKDIDF